MAEMDFLKLESQIKNVEDRFSNSCVSVDSGRVLPSGVRVSLQNDRILSSGVRVSEVSSRILPQKHPTTNNTCLGLSTKLCIIQWILEQHTK